MTYFNMITTKLPDYRFHQINYMEITALKAILRDQEINVSFPMASKIYIFLDMLRRCYLSKNEDNVEDIKLTLELRDIIDFIIGSEYRSDKDIKTLKKSRLNSLNSILNYMDSITFGKQKRKIVFFARMKNPKVNEESESNDHKSRARRIFPISLTLPPDFKLFCKSIRDKAQDFTSFKYQSFRLFKNFYPFLFSKTKNAILFETTIQLIYKEIKSLSDYADNIMRDNTLLHPKDIVARTLIDAEALKKNLFNEIKLKIVKKQKESNAFFKQFSSCAQKKRSYAFISALNRALPLLRSSERRRLKAYAETSAFEIFQYFQTISLIALDSFCRVDVNYKNEPRPSPCEKRISEFVDRELKERHLTPICSRNDAAEFKAAANQDQFTAVNANYYNGYEINEALS